MGYTTEFIGQFEATPPLTEEQAAYLRAFRDTRRMKRDPKIAATFPDPVREAVGLPIGVDAGYFVGAGGFAGQDQDESIIDYNDPPHGQPELWCQWVPTMHRDGIEWDEGEKFYEYTDWLAYIIEHFLGPWGITLNGVVYWSGEESYDRGRIIVTNNEMLVQAVKDDPPPTFV